jgi:hypothetical protein
VNQCVEVVAVACTEVEVVEHILELLVVVDMLVHLVVGRSASLQNLVAVVGIVEVAFVDNLVAWEYFVEDIAVEQKLVEEGIAVVA